MPYKNYEYDLERRQSRYANDAEFRERQKETSRRNGKLRRQAKRAWWVNLRQSLNCARCSENHPATLDFRHIDPTQKDRSLRDLIDGGYSLKRIEAELAKCIVLCSNCHRKEHYDKRTQHLKVTA